MAIFSKPTFNTVWASSGDKVSPDSGKITQGWIIEIPPHQYQNWIDNRQDQMLAHLNQYGVGEWDSTTEYQANKSYVQGVSTGTIYKCLVTNTNINPETDVNNNWVIAFEDAGTSLKKSQNLADVPDKAAARTNLGIATTADYDARYLLKASNFADVPNKSSARGNLEVYSRQEVIDLLNAYSPAGEVAPFARTSAPSGWLVCDGSAVSRTTYARLFSAIGTNFGVGNGSTTFNLPDIRGEFVRGVDLGRGLDPGRGFGSVQAGAIQNHNHFLPTTETPSGSTWSIPDTVWQKGSSNAQPVTGEFATTFGTTGTVGTFAGETRPRNIALLYCIRT